MILRLSLLLAGLFFVYGCGRAEPPAAGKAATWYSFNEGHKKAQTEKKAMVVDFYTSWCHWCKVMDEKTFTDTAVAAYLKKSYICVRINAEDTQEKIDFQGKTFNPVDFTRAAGVNGFPSLAFFDKEQQLVTIIPGYVEADMFLKILEYMDHEYYKNQIKLDDYIKQGVK
jgi:thioredoxin-related protein